MAMAMKLNEPVGALIAGHPIAVVAERTGLSRDVLRVWERRYSAVEPTRTPGGQRLYSDADVARFRLLALATKHGRSISQVAGIPTPELQRLVAEDEAARPAAEPVSSESAYTGAHAESVDVAIECTRALDGTSLDRVLRRAIAQYGPSVFLEHIVPPLMHRIGDEWHKGRLSVAHEHLASATIVALILECIHAVPETPSAPRLLVTTPSGERHAVGAALAAAAAALEGWTVVYLGVDVPAADIVAAAAATGARAVAMSVVYTDDPGFVSRELLAVRANLAARVPLLVGGVAAMLMSSELEQPGLVVCGSIAEMREALARETVTA